MPAPLTLQAIAKINLCLHVTGRRKDGYHLLDSLVVFPRDIYDEISIAPAGRFSFTADGLFSKDLEQDASNLAVKAAQAIAQIAGKDLALSIHLTKNIPLGAGLGGGSADAAATVKGLEAYWNVSLTDKQRQDILLSLGADVPVCYVSAACRFQGVGEHITALPSLPPLYVLLIWPGKPSFTKDIFAHFKRPFAAPLPEQIPPLQSKDEFLRFLQTTENSLEESAQYLCPDIAAAHEFVTARTGCLFARMTGSGAAVFGLFESEELCAKAEKSAKTSHLNWWCRSSPL